MDVIYNMSPSIVQSQVDRVEGRLSSSIRLVRFLFFESVGALLFISYTEYVYVTFFFLRWLFRSILLKVWMTCSLHVVTMGSGWRGGATATRIIANEVQALHY